MDFILLTKEPIEIDALLKDFSCDPASGARVWFEGVVRNENEGKAVRGIFYEAYEKMAEKELGKIKEEARAKWPLHQIAIIHRLGELKVGETSLIVTVSAAHRMEGFEAIQYILSRLKQKVPVWKKEIYEAGKAEWL